MSIHLAKPPTPSSGNPGCDCPGDACEPWCTCQDCDSRPEALCHITVGVTFGTLVQEMVELLSDDKCGDHVFSRAGRDDDGNLVLVFDAPADAEPDGLRLVASGG